ncbi:uncharacterized protein [Nothobranchius furzeri]|uniref:uncharacterized protein isoform X3 n=1 Tax=Nothobranchius furzeri TaxID=105023 RepID=UPI0039049651
MKHQHLHQLFISPTPVPALSSIHGESSERDDNLEEVMEQGETKKEESSQMLSCVGIEANIDEEEFNNIQNSVIESSDDTWSPNRETEVDSSSEEDETIEMDSGTDDSGDEDYTPYIHIRLLTACRRSEVQSASVRGQTRASGTTAHGCTSEHIWAGQKSFYNIGLNSAK